MNPLDVTDAVDRLLLEQGELDMLRLLQWLGLIECQPGALPAPMHWPADAARASAILESAQAYCHGQGLEAVAHAASPAWPAASTRAERELTERCGIVMRRPDSATQFDLFHDSRSAYAEAAVRSALLERRLDEARTALQRCDDPATAAQLSQLIEALASPPSGAAQRIAWLDREITALAQRRLGSAAKVYLAGLWSDLAAELDGVAFDAERPLEHASHAWLRAGDGERACACIEQQAGWEQQPALLARLARARARTGRLDKARLAWMQLCWRFSDEAETALNEDPGEFALKTHWGNFRSAELEFATADFPAWMLVADNRHLDFVPVSTAPQDAVGAAYTALHELIRSGGEMSARRQLHARHPALLQLYLAAVVPSRTRP
ncbi:MAG: hypothetical protein JWQ90_5525 [Hydrocarboniphaga sp.]|uniref:hypothetical protein n=1 Tax=Hydrocarboniphaga sp. TaxID=2033016 RepID=UPI00261EDD5C|nr:hypothetical protein [Hydrocarboniphaga sp.]MDB5973075.1 hypothetical protein [Hydrocarboniphaga sp.]